MSNTTPSQVEAPWQERRRSITFSGIVLVLASVGFWIWINPLKNNLNEYDLTTLSYMTLSEDVRSLPRSSTVILSLKGETSSFSAGGNRCISRSALLDLEKGDTIMLQVSRQAYNNDDDYIDVYSITIEGKTYGSIDCHNPEVMKKKIVILTSFFLSGILCIGIGFKKSSPEIIALKVNVTTLVLMISIVFAALLNLILDDII